MRPETRQRRNRSPLSMHGISKDEQAPVHYWDTDIRLLDEASALSDTFDSPPGQWQRLPK
jgi:hypothetical protein